MDTLQLGRATIDSIVELEVAFEPEWLLTEGATADVLREFDAYGPRLIDPTTGGLKLTIQSYLLRTPRQTILIDTCCGNERERPSVPFFHRLDTDYLERLSALVRPDSVDIVLCSHLHVDHVGWNVTQDGERFVPTFPNATYLFSAPEYHWWRDLHARGAGSPQAKAAFLECVEPLVRSGQARLVEPDHCLEDSDDVDARLVELPGHTMHQVGVSMGAGGRRVLFCADAVHHAIQFVHPTWRSRPDSDPALGEKTARALIETYADTDTIILTSHSPHPNACHLVRDGDAARLLFVGETPPL